MKATVLMLLMAFTTFGMGQEELDSILAKSRNLHNGGVKGFIVKQRPQQQMMAPDELFGVAAGGDIVEEPEEAEKEEEQEEQRPVEELRRTPRRQHRLESEPTAYVSYEKYLEHREKRTEEITEIKLKLDKLSESVGHILGHSNDQRKMIELITKFIESLTPLLIALGGLFSWNKVKEHKKKKLRETQMSNLPQES